MVLNKEHIIKKYDLDIGKVAVYNHYMIAELNEGIELTLEKTSELIGISELHFRNRDFAYITVRKNSYSVDPIIYRYIRKIENLKALAIVSLNTFDQHSFNFEKYFFSKKNMRLFQKTEDAINWIKTIIKDNQIEEN